MVRLAVSLLPPINNRLNFHQAHEGAAEAAWAGVTEAQGDIRNPLVGFHEQMASRVEANFRDHFAVAGAHLTEMTLKRTRAHS